MHPIFQAIDIGNKQKRAAKTAWPLLSSSVFRKQSLKENLGKLVHNISYQDNLFIYVYLIYFRQNMTIWVYYIRMCEKNCHQISLGVSLLAWRCSGRWPGCLVIGGLEGLSNPKGLSRSNHPQKV